MPNKKWETSEVLLTLLRTFGIRKFQLKDALEVCPGTNKILSNLAGLGFLESEKTGAERWFRIVTPEDEDQERYKKYRKNRR